MTTAPTVAAPPSTQAIVSQILASMAAISGVLTDYNPGSQIRTIAESLGAVGEQQGIWTQTVAFQAMVYGAMAVLGISPYPAFQASTVLTFATAASGAPVSSQNIAIPSGTITQTTGGVQFSTIAAATLLSGTTSINVNAIATLGGIAGNVTAGAVNQIVTGLLYPLVVTNALAASGGTNPESASQTISRFGARVASIGLASPVAIANSAIGVTYSGTGEVVLYSTLYEPWIAAGTGAGSGTAGWSLYLDNGNGTASSGLITAVTAKLNGGPASGQVGYRDAGVPYTVLAVTPTVAVVGVTGVVSTLTTTGAVTGLISAAVSGYFTLPFGTAPQQAVLSQTVGNSVLGLMTSLTVSLYASGSATPLTTLPVSVNSRAVLGSLSLSITAS